MLPTAVLHIEGVQLGAMPAGCRGCCQPQRVAVLIPPSCSVALCSGAASHRSALCCSVAPAFRQHLSLLLSTGLEHIPAGVWQGKQAMEIQLSIIAKKKQHTTKQKRISRPLKAEVMQGSQCSSHLQHGSTAED